MLTLPNGKSQFLDADGNPLAGGFVYHYVPGTTTPKDTYKDYGGAALNTNPIVLEPDGFAVIFGDGSYRQIVTDSLGNQLWDQNTKTAQVSDALPLTGGTLTGALTVPSLTDTAQQLITVSPTGDAVSTLTSLSVQGSTLSTTTREFLVNVSLITNKRNGGAGSITPSVALYTGVQGQNGTSDIWSVRSTMTQDAGSGTYNGIAHEIDVVNNVANRGDTLGSAGLASPVSYGVAISATGTLRSTAAVLVTAGTAQLFNRGFCVSNNSVAQAAFQDLGNSTISYEIQGTHTYGIDAKAANLTGAAIRLGNGQYIKARDVGDTTDYKVLVQSATNLFLGDTTAGAIVANNIVEPVTDNVYTCGANGLRWSAVWSANGAIQTSDPTLKTDITVLASMPPETISGLLAAIQPIRFRWVSGGKDVDGNDVPGKRLHWGWDAENIKSAFDAAGSDFGGFVLGDDGTKHLRPDQLIPVLWRAVQMLTERVASLEAKSTSTP